MADTLDFMYPEQTWRTPTVLSLPVGRLPGAPAPGGHADGSPRDFYGAGFMMEVEVGDTDRVAFIEKAFPHSRYDLMMLASDEQVKCAVTDLADQTKQFMFAAAGRFIGFISQADVISRYGLDGGHLHLAFNYDRYTTDRENSMCCDKRFHLHLNYWPGDELGLLRPVRWGDIPEVTLRWRLIDPLAHLTGLVMRDRCRELAPGLPLMPVDPGRDEAIGLPAGPKIEFPGWSVLRDREFVTIMDSIHEVADSAYQEIHVAFTGERSKPRVWSRPSLLPREQIARNLRETAWLSDDTRRLLTRLAFVLRDVTAARMRSFRDGQADPVRGLTLGGLDYAITMFCQQRNSAGAPLADAGPVYLVMHGKLFADVGGAGLPSIGSIPVVRLDRASGHVLSDAEVKIRRQLREEFLALALPSLLVSHQARRLA